MKASESAKPKPFSAILPFETTDYEADAYKLLEGQKTTTADRIWKAVESGKAKIVDAILYLGRFNQDGHLLRESSRRKKSYRLFRCRSSAEYDAALAEGQRRWDQLEGRIAESERRREAVSKIRLSARAAKKRAAIREDYFTSASDLGSLYSPDPNQFTEFTPYFNGPYSKQQYFDYFQGHSRAFEQYNHSPVAKRIVDILIQYALGRGFKVRAKKTKLDRLWTDWNKKNRITHKLRKYWGREYLIYGENFLDKLRWVSVDPSTILDIVCEGFDEYIDQVLYYQQMFQTATQMYAGIQVPGVAGSGDSKIGKYIIRQIPAEQIIHIKTNITSGEKRGRSILYSVLGWIKRLNDFYNAQVLGEQLRASFVWDDTVDGGDDDVAAHGAKYQYIPVAPSIFVHNKAVERKALAPMTGISGNGANSVGNEILAMIATAVGLPKEHLNVMMSGGGNRATAIVGSEPFTKVIEDLQEDFSDLLHQIIEAFCAEVGEDYDADDWQIIFPSVVKDSTADRLKNIALCVEMKWFSKKRGATMAAVEMEADSYDYDQEMADIEQEQQDEANSNPSIIGGSPFGAAGLNPIPKPPQPGAKKKAQPQQDEEQPSAADKNPIHGKGKQKIIAQHKNL